MADPDKPDPPPAPAPAKARLFLSRSSQDRAIAQQLIADLSRLGYEVRAQDHDILTGEDFRHFMDKTLRECAATVALLSSSYLASDWCRDEAVSAHRNANHRLIPMVVEDGCTPDGLIAAFVFLDVVQRLRDDFPSVAKLIDEVLSNGKPLDQNPPARAFMRQSQFVANIPFDDAALLVGRDDATQELDAALASQGSTVAITALAGMGGVGKSWLARVYATRNRTRYHGVWMVRAEKESEIAEDLAALGAQLDPQIAAAVDRPAAARATLDLLARMPGRPILLIFDNVETPDAIRAWRPRAGVHMIITSRWGDWTGTGATPVRLDILAPPAAVELLRGLAPRTSAADAAIIAERLGWLPLALTHAGAVLRRSGLTAEQYLRDLDRRLSTLPPSSGDYPEAVRAALESNLEQLAEHNTDAPALLEIAAFCASDGMPLELWEQKLARDVLPPSLHDDVALREALGALETFSLARIDWDNPIGHAFSVHRLVQQITRARLAEQQRYETVHAHAIAALTLLTWGGLDGKTAPPDFNEKRNWPTFERYVPHARQMLALLPESQQVLEAALLATYCGNYLSGRMQFNDAIAMLRRAAAILEALQGPDAPVLSTVLNNLALVLENKQLFAEAEACLRRSAAIIEKTAGADSPLLAIALTNLADVFIKSGDLDNVEATYRRAISIFEAAQRQTGAAHPLFGAAFSRLGAFLAQTGRFAEAEPIIRQALALDEKVNGADHYTIAFELSALGDILIMTNRLAEAERVSRRGLDVSRVSLGPQHHQVAVALNQLANILKDQGRLAEAEPLYLESLAIVEANLGPSDPHVGVALNNLGEFYHEASRGPEAEAALRRALAIAEAAYGADHPQTFTALVNLSRLLGDMGRNDEAEPLLRRAIAIAESGDKDAALIRPQLDVALNNLGMLLYHTHRNEEAEATLRRSLALTESVYGPSHTKGAGTLHNIACLLADTDRQAEAATLLRRALAIFEASLPETHPSITIVRNKLAAVEAGTPPEREPTVH